MADGYVSQVQLPNNETYNIRDKELIPRLKATVGHSNKNLLNLKNISGKTENGITWTIDEQEGIVTATGTVQSGKTSQLEFILKDIPSGNYYFYGCIGGSDATYDVYCWDYTTSSRPKQWNGTTNVYSDYNLVPRQLKIVDNHEIGIILRINSGVTVNNLIFKPMVWDGDILDDIFEPYQEPTDKLIETKTRTYLNSTVGHACKNLLDVAKYTTISGISDIQINEDTGSLSFTGTGTWRCISYLINDDISLKPNGITYILTCINNLATSTAQLVIRRGDTNTIVYSTSLSTTGKKELKFTASSEKFPNGWYISILVTKGTSSTGSADVSNLMLREASISDDTFESYQIPTDERFKDYLPLSGGTMTGKLMMSDSTISMKDTNIDLAGDNPTSLTWSKSEINFYDKNNKRAGFINIARGTDGSTRLDIDAQCRKSDNSGDYYNGITIIAKRDGTKSYSVSDPAAFRTAIGAGTSSTDNKTQQTLNNNDKDYPLLFSYAEEDNTTTDITNISYRNNDFFINPSSGYIYSKKGFCAGPFKTATAGKRVWVNQDGIYANNFLDDYSIKAYERMIIRAWAGKHTSANGLLLTVDSGGLTMIGGGESSTNLANLIDNNQTTDSPKRLDINNSQDATDKETTALTADSEHLVLSSDGSIYFVTGCQTLANRAAVCLNNARTFYPMTDNSGKIGSSSFRWQYGYFGQVCGTGSAGAWKSARDNASFIKSTPPNTATYAPVIDLKTISGDWSIGSLDSSESLYFVYVADSIYSGSTNTARKYKLQAPSTPDAYSYDILHSGNTSFTQTLSSGTKIGTIKINGTSTDLYCQTNTDTKNTAGSTDTSDKIFLIGAKSQAANPQTYSDDQVYVTNGSLYLTKETDAAGTKDNKPALLIGNPTSTHLELDTNEVMSKASATTTGPLYLNNDGGLVYINNKKAVRLTSDPTSGQIMIADGTNGQIKSSGYTINKSVPSNAVFTDTWRNIKVNGTEKLGTGTGTGALNFKNGTNTTVTYDSGIKISATDSKVTQTLNNTQDSYYSLLFSKKTIDDDDAETTDTVYRSSNVSINPNGYLYAKNLYIGGGSDSGALTLYGYSGGSFVLGELTQPFSISGGIITHSLPLRSGDLFGSGNLIAGTGIKLKESAGIYTISARNQIYSYGPDTNFFNDITDDTFRNCRYFKIYYKDSNNCNYNCITMNMDENIFPTTSTTSYASGNVFTLSCVGDVNKTYLRTATFHFVTKGGGMVWKLVFNSSFLWDPSNDIGSSITWKSTKQTSYSNSYIKIIKIEYLFEDI